MGLLLMQGDEREEEAEEENGGDEEAEGSRVGEGIRVPIVVLLEGTPVSLFAEHHLSVEAPPPLQRTQARRHTHTLYTTH